MDLRALREEAETLSRVDYALKAFRKCWIKPLRDNTNSQLPSLRRLSAKKRANLGPQIDMFWKQLKELEQSQSIKDKINLYVTYLRGLALSNLQQNNNKSRYITSQILTDDALNISKTIAEVKSCARLVKTASKTYLEINEIVTKYLSKPEKKYFNGLPHHQHWGDIIKISRKQTKLIQQIGQNVIDLARKDLKDKKAGDGIKKSWR
ncbi:MAG TPA: hypothetical protein VJC39_05130 [Candidatus Nanoarchaeia archaeon]|nr:hypothetical protein [Candidatus Nanoarchaeia archaeon]